MSPRQCVRPIAQALFAALLALSAVALTLVQAPVVAAASFVVTNTADSGAGSLRQALLDANSSAGADTITFSLPGEGPWTIGLTSAELLLSSDVTVDGPGAGLLTVRRSNTGTFRIFTVSGGVKATLKGLTISNGSASNGAGILNSGTLTVTQSIVSGNTAAYPGGGIYNQGTLTVTQSTVSGNTAAYPGGGIYNQGTLTVSQSTIISNTATSQYGGGIYNQGTLTVSQSTISGNTAIYEGGGIFHNSGTLTLSQSTLSNNTSTVGDGGGIFHNSGTLTLSQSTLSGNTANYGGGILNISTLYLYQSTLSGNNARVNGGGLYNVASVVVRNSTITANRADSDGNGSGIGGGITQQGAFNLGNTIVAKNFRGAGTTEDNIVGGFVNGGPNLTSGDPKLGPLADNGGPTLTHAPLEGSPAINGGSAPTIPPDTLDMDGDTNTIEPAPFDQRGSGYARVSGIAPDLGAVELGGVSISATDTTAEEAGGTAVFLVARGATTGEVNVKLTASGTAAAADYTLSGAGVTGTHPDYTVTIPAAQSSAAITLTPADDTPAEAAETATLTVASDPAYTVGNPSSASATIAANDTVVTSTADDGEGSLRQALTNANSFDGADTVSFSLPDGATITLASALPNLAGQLTIAGPGATKLTVSGGGAVRVFAVASGAEVTIKGLTISGGNDSLGGGISNQGTLTVSQSTLSDNQGGTGGGISNQGTLTVTQSTLSGNTGYYGGSIYNLGTLTVTQSTLSGNGGTYGAGIYNDNGTLTVRQSTLSGNTANEGAGGGIYNNGTLALSQSTLSGNTATNEGGGIYHNSGTLTLSQSTLSGNSANEGGGIINYDTLTVRNSTITANRADSDGDGSGVGGGIAQYGTLSLGNTIVAGNVKGAEAIEDNIVGEFTAAGNNLTSGDPKLGPLADNGGPTKTHAPLSGSPAIGGGTAAGVPQDTLDMDGDGNTTEPVPFDQRGAGFPRVLGSAPELGAVEVAALSISATDATADEAGGTATFTISRDSAGEALAVKLTASGTAAAADYTLSGAGVTGTHPDYTVTIPAGETSVALTLTPADDTPAEAAETVSLALVSDATYLVGSPSSASATIAANDTVVTTIADDGEGSLRQAITNANSFDGADTVSFSLPDGATITLASALPDLKDQLTIDGPGASLLTVSGGGAVRVFRVVSGAEVTIKGLTISGGKAGEGGGGILNAGTLTVSRSTISGNTALWSEGGGILNSGTLTVSQSTFSFNNANSSGGGILNRGTLALSESTFSFNSANWGGGITNFGTATVSQSTVNGNGGSHGGGITNYGTLTLSQSTVSGNSAEYAGGIDNDGGTLTVRNSTITANRVKSDGAGGGMRVISGVVSLGNTIVAGNVTGAEAIEDNIVGAFTETGHNLTSGDPKLGPLADNGGPTKTHAPLDGSPALDAGSADAVPQDDLDMDGDTNITEPVPFDQRGKGFPRVARGVVDIGAVEAEIISVRIDQPSVSTTASGPVSYVVTFAGATGYTFNPGKVTLHKTGTATGSVAVSGSGPQFTVTISAISGEGTLGISVAAGAAHDDDGNLAPEAGPSATFTVHQEQNDPRPYKAFLPVMQRLPNQPDLVVEAIGTDEGQLTVTIANIGGAATGEGFWVDLAIAPRRAPARVNDTWASVGSRGMAWGVARSLAPGERLTLTVGDAYYAAEHSSPGGPIAAGTALYAHVDSASTTNTYGGVRESHEVTGEAYNNVLGPVAATTEVAVTALDVAPAASPAGARLPARR